MILVVGGIKGGTGKTTLAINMAICQVLSGKHVLLIDADEQRSCVDWHNQREVCHPNLLVQEFRGKEVLYEIQNAIEEEWYDDIIVDCGGRDTTSQRAALVNCDVFLVPFRPRSLDIWTCVSLKMLNDEIMAINEKFQLRAVLNQCEPRGGDKEVVRQILSENGVKCLNSQIGYRRSISDATSLGLGIKEYSKADIKSIQEISNLHDEIYSSNMT